jgi:hypothetical protein
MEDERHVRLIREGLQESLSGPRRSRPKHQTGEGFART